MILLDAIYINEGGGKILLDLLIQKLELINKPVFYLLDERVKEKVQPIKSSNKVEFLRSNLIKRHFFYKKNHKSFSKVLCFGNIPPTLKLKCEVFTYFHNVIILEYSKDYSFKENTLFFLKRNILKFFDSYTTSWLVQSNLMKSKLQQNLGVNFNKVYVLPFYNEININSIKLKRYENSYIYVSNGMPHKNHYRLIDVFCKFFDIHQKGVLILTVSENFTSLISLINIKKSEGYPINNIGFVEKEVLNKAYLRTRFLIFPSLKESFGLGLIEGIDFGCKIIAADLPYTHEVCYPSITFNPENEESMLDAFNSSLGVVKSSNSKIKNNLNELINLLY